MHDRKCPGPFQNVKALILASGSPRRADLLGSLGIDFDIIVSNAEEPPFPGGNPAEYVLETARIKMLPICDMHPDKWIIAADTVVFINGSALGKPGTPEDAFSMLRKLSGRWHTVISGFLVGEKETGTLIKKFAESRVKIRNLKESEIWSYIATGEPMDKAGSYAVQGLGAFMIDQIEGSYTNVIGLPLSETADVLLSLGIIKPRSLPDIR